VAEGRPAPADDGSAGGGARRPVRVPGGLSRWLAFLIQLQWLVAFQRSRGLEHFDGSPRHLLLYAVALAAPVLLICAADQLLARLPRLRVAASLWLLALTHLGGAYAYRNKTFPDFSVVIDNIADAFSPQAMVVIATAFGMPHVGVTLLGVLGLALLHRSGRVELVPPAASGAAWRGAAALSLYLLAVALPWTTPDPVLSFHQSVRNYIRGQSPYAVPYQSGTYPYVATFVPAHPVRAPDEALPNVFIIMVESYNARFLETAAPNGRPYTPVFDSLIPQGLFVERFYGNSIQTSKGQVAALCGILPSLRGKIFRRFPALRLRCLQDILADAGYRTVFFKAHHNINFDNTGPFLRRHGFEVVESAGPYYQADEQERMLEWGARDRDFYQAFFRFLEANPALGTGPAPLFAVLHTAYTHTPFTGPADEERTVYHEPTTVLEDYANSLSLSDGDLRVFFERLASHPALANSVVIVTGDHSFPLGDHGVTGNEVGFYEESFLTPFLLLWPGHVAPQRLHQRHSQLDIAPTVVDLLGLPPVRSHFQGVSMLDPADGQQPIYLIQPYSGRYLGVIRYPWKYVLHERSGKEYLFDLARDPGEEINRAGELTPAARRDWQQEIRKLYLHQKLIYHDAIWPDRPAAGAQGKGTGK
jgi:arylsulfatase A-like enzyme